MLSNVPGCWLLWHSRVNHIADDRLYAVASTGELSLRHWMLAALMPLASLLTYGTQAVGLGLLAVALSTVAYFAVLAVMYAAARLSFDGCTWLLWGGIVSAVVVAFLLTGTRHLGLVLADQAMIFIGGVVAGRLAAAGVRPARVFSLALATTAVFAIAKWGPMWPDLIAAADSASQAAIEQLRPLLVTFGYSEQAATDSLLRTEKVFDLIVRLTPAATVLSALVQFCLAMLLFAWVISIQPGAERWRPNFSEWRMPFAFTPVVLILVGTRLVGGEILQQIADNVIAVAAVAYLITGLALIEYYMKRFDLSVWLKVLFYLFLFLTQMIGFFVVALVGFVDSFADWRARDRASTAQA